MAYIYKINFTQTKRKENACHRLPLMTRQQNLWQRIVTVTVSLLFALGGEAVLYPHHITAWAEGEHEEKINPSLQMAVKEGQEDKVQALIAAGVNVNARDNLKDTPLHYAKHVNIVQALIAAGANVNAKNSRGNTPLHNISVRNAAVVDALITAGANVNAKNELLITPLHRVTKAKDAKTLIAAGANVNAESHYKKTPLHMAALHWYTLPRYPSLSDILKSREEKKQWYNDVAGVVNTLIAAGANVNARDSSGKTPLAYAKDDIVVILKKAGATL